MVSGKEAPHLADSLKNLGVSLQQVAHNWNAVVFCIMGFSPMPDVKDIPQPLARFRHEVIGLIQFLQWMLIFALCSVALILSLLWVPYLTDSLPAETPCFIQVFIDIALLIPGMICARASVIRVWPERLRIPKRSPDS